MDAAVINAAACSMEKLQAIVQRTPDLRSEIEKKILQRFCETNEFFSQLPLDQQVAACNVMAWNHFRQDTILIREGDVVEDSSLFHVILSGNLKVYVITPTASTGYGLEVATLSIGETVGEGSLHVKNGSKRNATVLSSSETYTVSLTKADVLRIVKSKANLLFSPVHCRRILAKDPEHRTAADLKFLGDVMSRFASFRMLPKVIVNEMCKHLKLSTYPESSVVRRQGDQLNPEFGVILKGNAAVFAMEQDLSEPASKMNAKRRLRLLQWEAKKVLGKKVPHMSSVSLGSHLCELTPGDTIGESAIVAEWVSDDITGVRGSHSLQLHGVESVSIQAKDRDLQLATLHRAKYDEIMTAQQAFINPNSTSAVSALTTPPEDRNESHLSILRVLIGNLNVLRPAPAYIKDKLSSLFRWARYEPGSAIYTQGATSDGFYVVLEGCVGFHAHESPEDVEAMNRVLSGKPAFGESAIHSESVTSSKVQIDEAPSIHSIHSVHSGPSKQSLPSLHEASHTSAPAPGGSVYDEGSRSDPPEARVLEIYGPELGRLFPGDSFGQEELVAEKNDAPTAKHTRRSSNALIGGSSRGKHEIKQRQYSVVAVTAVQVLELDTYGFYSVLETCPAALMPQMTGALMALKTAPGLRSDLQLSWIRSFMGQQRFLSQVPSDSIDKLAHTVTLQEYAKGEFVTFQGEKGKNFYVVLSGRFKVYEKPSKGTLPDGYSAASEHTVSHIGVEVASLTEGDSFGDKVFQFEDSESVLRATVVCAQHGSEVAVISEDDYKLHFLQHSDNICFVPKHAIEVFKKDARDRTVDDERHALSLIGRLQFFRQLPPVRVQALCAALRYAKVPTGRFVCHQGEVGKHFYVVLSGTAGVYVRAPGAGASGTNMKRGALRRLSCVNGDDEVGRLVARLGPGDSFGENALHQNVRRNASVGCLTNMELLVLSREQYIDIVADLADKIEFRPQLLHEKLVSATTEASKTEMLFALVKNADGFKDLSREQLWQVVTTASYEVFANGQTVYATGDKSSDVYIILSGGVKVVMEGASIAFLCDRDVFGHLEVALRVSRRVASVVASEETKAVRLSRHVYTTMWPSAKQHCEDVLFLQNLPGLTKVSSKSLIALYYNVITKVFQRGTVIVREGDPCPNLCVVRDGFCTATRLTPVTYTAKDGVGNPIVLPVRKAGTPLPLTLSTLRPVMHHNRLKTRAAALSKIGSMTGGHSKPLLLAKDFAAESRGALAKAAEDQLERKVVLSGTATILGQELVSFPIADIGPSSCFCGGEAATETVTASSCSVKVLLFPKAKLSETFGAAISLMAEMSTSFRSQRVDGFQAQIEGSAAVPQYTHQFPTPGEKGLDPRLCHDLCNTLPHASANIPTRRLMPQTAILARVVANNSSHGRPSSRPSTPLWEAEAEPSSAHDAGVDAMRRNTVVFEESYQRQRRASVDDGTFTGFPCDHGDDQVEDAAATGREAAALVTQPEEFGPSLLEPMWEPVTPREDEPDTDSEADNEWVTEGDRGEKRPPSRQSLSRGSLSQSLSRPVFLKRREEAEAEEAAEMTSSHTPPASSRRSEVLLFDGGNVAERPVTAVADSESDNDDVDSVGVRGPNSSRPFTSSGPVWPVSSRGPRAAAYAVAERADTPEEEEKKDDMFCHPTFTFSTPIRVLDKPKVYPPKPTTTGTTRSKRASDTSVSAHHLAHTACVDLAFQGSDARDRRRSAHTPGPPSARGDMPVPPRRLTASPMLVLRDPNKAMLEAATAQRIFATQARASKAERMFDELMGERPGTVDKRASTGSVEWEGERGLRATVEHTDTEMWGDVMRPVTSHSVVEEDGSGLWPSRRVSAPLRSVRAARRVINNPDRFSDNAPQELYVRRGVLSTVAATTLLPTLC